MRAHFNTAHNYDTGAVVIRMTLDGQPWAIAACPGGRRAPQKEIEAAMIAMQEGLVDETC